MPVVPTGRLHTSDIQPMSLLQAPQTSQIVLKLKELSYNKHTETEQVVRSEGFAEKAVLPKPDVTLETVRDDRLALVEKLELGPVEHRAMAGDPNFEKHEPNSGIRLRYVHVKAYIQALTTKKVPVFYPTMLSKIISLADITFLRVTFTPLCVSYQISKRMMSLWRATGSP